MILDTGHANIWLEPHPAGAAGELAYCLVLSVSIVTCVVQELISEIDQDGNGAISFNEFVWLMTR